MKKIAIPLQRSGSLSMLVGFPNPLAPAPDFCELGNPTSRCRRDWRKKGDEETIQTRETEDKKNLHLKGLSR